jgi:hypothetical protein
MKNKTILKWTLAIMFVLVSLAVVGNFIRYQLDPHQDCWKRGGLVIKSQRGWHCSEQAK